ncbi:MAG TPA: hypothetical protein VG053_01665 [Solirubrobacteraceae bacterium]|nr:hypothetical protein [Solirubrobacteraceae bacterium]
MFTITGGAYAAGKYVITSTKQIKPSVLASLKGAGGKSGAPGPQGPAGPQGAAGAAGKDGSNGTDGKDGTNGKDGVSVSSSAEPAGANCKAGGSKFVATDGTTYACNGENGKNGTTGFTETLPSGKTETGVWSFGSFKNVGALTSLSYNIPLAEPLAAGSVHFVKKSEWEGGTGPAACQGTAPVPLAEKGNLCVYEGQLAGEFAEILKPSSGNEGSDASGAALIFVPKAEEEPISGFGTWAVTAK